MSKSMQGARPYRDSVREAFRKDPQAALDVIISAFDDLFGPHPDGAEQDVLLLALRDAVEALGMSEIARTTGLSRSNLYHTLDQGGDPKLSTFVAILKGLGLRLRLETADRGGAHSSHVDDDQLRRRLRALADQFNDLLGPGSAGAQAEDQSDSANTRSLRRRRHSQVA